MEYLHRHPGRQIIPRHQLVDIRTIAFQQVFRRLHIFGKVIEHLDLLILIDTHDTRTSTTIVDRGQILQVMQSPGRILYLHGTQIVDRFVFLPGFLLLFFGFGDIVTDNDIIGILSHLEGRTGRVFRIERRQSGRDIGTGNIVGSQQDRIKIKPYLRLTAVVGNVGVTDKLLLIEVIAEIFGYELHHIEVGTFYHDPFAVIAYSQQAHKATQATHGRATSSATAHRLVDGYFHSLDVGQLRLYIGFDIGNLTFTYFRIVVFQDKGKHGIRLTDTADQVFHLRKVGQTFLHHLDDLVGVVERAAGLHRSVDVETVGVDILHLLDIQRDGEDQRGKQQDDGTYDRHPRITHASLQKDQINLNGTLYDRDFLVEHALPRLLPQQGIRSHRDEKKGNEERDRKGRDDRDADMMSDQLDHEIIGKDERQEHRHRRQRSGHNRAPHLPGTLRHRTLRRSSSAGETVDVLQYHHTVVE